MKNVLRTVTNIFMKLYRFVFILLVTEVKSLPSLTEFNDMLENYFTRENETTAELWDTALPTPEEQQQMKTILTSLYNDENVNLVDTLNSLPEIAHWITITELQNFYVVHEIIPVNSTRFPRFWGYAAIAKKSTRIRNIHHSAAHFESDGRVCHQAASVCESTGGVSVVVAGASRYAVVGNSSAPCQPQYTLTDVAHNAESMFHIWNVIIFDLVKNDVSTGLKNDELVLIQWHGMAETSCSASDVFITAGFTASSSIYTNDIPACKIRNAFNNLASSMNASTPDKDSTCSLTATTNVFGRYVNGVPIQLVCSTKAKDTESTGRFVHIEQKKNSRQSLDLWTNVLQTAFPSSGSRSPSGDFLFCVFLFVAILLLRAI